MRTLLLFSLTVVGSGASAQLLLGPSASVFVPAYRYAITDEAYSGTEGSASGVLGWSAGLTAVVPYADTVAPVTVIMEATYTQRAVDVYWATFNRGGSGAGNYHLTYGMVSLGLLPRFGVKGDDPWSMALGPRLAFPVQATRSGEAAAMSYSTLTDTAYSFHETQALSWVCGSEVRGVIALVYDQRLPSGGHVLVQAEVDHGFGRQVQPDVSGTRVNSTDLGLRMTYCFDLSRGR
jgi:hypothetical protein